MEDKRQVGNSSSSSVTMDDLFGPRGASSSSSSSPSGLFGSVFGPPPTGFSNDSSHRSGAVRKESANQYGNTKHGVSGNYGHSQNSTAEPCYFSSSIYYGGQEVYSPAGHMTAPQHNLKKDGGDDDANGSNSNSASRGNWWQGSLYY